MCYKGKGKDLTDPKSFRIITACAILRKIKEIAKNPRKLRNVPIFLESMGKFRKFSKNNFSFFKLCALHRKISAAKNFENSNVTVNSKSVAHLPSIDSSLETINSTWI